MRIINAGIKTIESFYKTTSKHSGSRCESKKLWRGGLYKINNCRINKMLYICNEVTNLLHTPSTIRSLFAGILLCVLTFAIMPKRFLHNLLANHKDTFTKKIDGKNELSKTGIYCECDNLVAASPFTDTFEKPGITIPVFFVSHEQKITCHHLSATHYFSGLRGPPAFGTF